MIHFLCLKATEEPSTHIYKLLFYSFYGFLFVWGHFLAPHVYIIVNMFRFSIFCYDLEIIDLIKTATCVANFLQVICSIEF